jgi:riboflavin synthase alpha subunit
MFTGIVREAAKVVAVKRRRGAWLLALRGPFTGEVKSGDSVCVQGVCLTVASKRGGIAYFDLSEGTRRRTTLGALREGDSVNVELSLRPSDRLGGHIVLGHVDGVGEVVRASPRGRLAIRVPRGLAKYLVPRGSVAVDGVSLTIAGVRGSTFSVNLIPHTKRTTTLGSLRPGARVNIEIDIFAKLVHEYLSRLRPRLLSSARSRPAKREARVRAASA